MPSDDDARNFAPRNAAFWAYLVAATVLGLALTGHALTHLTGADFGVMGGAFFVAAGLLVLLELRPLVTAGSPDANGVSTSTAFVFALLLHWGLGPALLMMTIATILADVVRRKAPWRTAFNVAQFAISYGFAWKALTYFGLHPAPISPVTVTASQLPAILAAGVVYFFVNNALVSQALALRNRSSFRAEFYDNFGYQIASTGALIGLAPIVVIVMERSPALVPLLLLPMAAVYATAALSLERERQALHDNLTGLPNRKLLVQRAREAFGEAKANDSRVALFLLDLDRFKEINDTFGHQYGDLLRQQIGPRLRGILHTTDTVARLGGDEFGILLPTADSESAVAVAQQLLRVLEAPFELDGERVEIGASIGIASCPVHGTDTATLLRQADVAMYVAKRGESGIVVYTAEQDHHSAERLALGGELRSAIEHDELLLHFQPKLDLRDGSLVGVEALVRWQHPQRGFLPPSDFIPLAEQTGLIYPLTRWVLEAALRQNQAWRALGLDIPVAVNLSRRSLQDPQLPEMVASLLARYDAQPSALVLEITESSLMTDPTHVSQNLAQLRALGVGMSIDDFGTGYSSLASLKNMPVDELKIDQSFVQAMATDASARAIVRAIIDLADALKLRVVAEGVEDRATWDVLAGLGCEVAQGYLISRPVAAGDLEAWIPDVGQVWLQVGGQSRQGNALRDRLRERRARLTTEEEFIVRKHADVA
jgi:diguanylate cyclase (GGDEF)-like protein